MSQEHLLTNQDEARVYAMQLSFTPALAMVLYTATELGLLDILSMATEGELTAAEVAARIPITRNFDDAAAMIDRMLHMLSAFCVVRCSVRDAEDGDAVERVYGLAPAGKFFLNAEGATQGSVAALLQYNASRAHMETWYQLKDTVLEGGRTKPFEKAHGTSVFEYTNLNPEFNKLFNKAMYGITKLSMEKLPETYKGFEGVKVLVDVGGCTGAFLSLVLSKYPAIKGINFDLPHVIESAPSYPGIKHVGGNMFEEIPNGDAILIKGVLHNWDDKDCVKILKNCYDALTKEGKVIIVDTILPVGADSSNQSKFSLLLDLCVLAMTTGKERTFPLFKSISMAAGFKFCRVACSVNGYSIIELLK